MLYRWRIDIHDKKDHFSEHKFVRAKDAQEAAEIAKKIWGHAVMGVMCDGPVTEEVIPARVKLEEVWQAGQKTNPTSRA